MKFLKVLLIGILVFGGGCTRGNVEKAQDVDQVEEVKLPEVSAEKVVVGFVDDYSGMKLADVMSDCGEIIGGKAEAYNDGFVGNAGWVPVVSVAGKEGEEVVFKWEQAVYEYTDEGLVMVDGNKFIKEEAVLAKKCEDGQWFAADYLKEGESDLFGTFLVEVSVGGEVVENLRIVLAQ